MKSKLKKKLQFEEESIEAKPRIAVSEPTTFKEETKKLWDDLLKKTGNDLLGGSLASVSEQLLGSADRQMLEGEEFLLKQKAKEEKPQITAEFMEYRREVINTERVGDRRTEMQVNQAVDQIRAEIKKLIQTSKLVERTVKDATVEQAPVKPGKYHITFFEFVLGIIRDATRKLEDTVHFGAVFTSKKQQSKYWTSFKKHGTSFGLSGERTTATQTG